MPSMFLALESEHLLVFWNFRAFRGYNSMRIRLILYLRVREGLEVLVDSVDETALSIIPICAGCGAICNVL